LTFGNIMYKFGKSRNERVILGFYQDLARNIDSI